MRFWYNVVVILRAHVIVEGRVQGVYYRAFTQNQAVLRQLNGWVRNLRDGRVEAVFEGQKELIEQAILVCKQGPSGAQVTDIHITWESPLGEQGFQIRY